MNIWSLLIVLYISSVKFLIFYFLIEIFIEGIISIWLLLLKYLNFSIELQTLTFEYLKFFNLLKSFILIFWR
jgi:hypothetical protein